MGTYRPRSRDLQSFRQTVQMAHGGELEGEPATKLDEAADELARQNPLVRFSQIQHNQPEKRGYR